VFAECLAVGLACGDQRRFTGSGSALEAITRNALYKATFTLLLLSNLTDLLNGDVDRFVHDNPRDSLVTTWLCHRPVVRHVVLSRRH